ncbi:unnamed protein product [Urochloa humidicola]
MAACGFDIPDVRYMHGVDCTISDDKGKGSALLFLLPEELKFQIYLKVWRMVLNTHLENQMDYISKRRK